MIEWDEIFEDVNWPRMIGLILAGIVVIGGIVFVLLDYSRAQHLQELLQQDLVRAQNYKQAWNAGTKDIATVKAERDKWQAAVDDSGVTLPTEIDAKLIENKIRQTASQDGVKLMRLDVQPEKTDGYALVRKMDIQFESNTSGAAKNFLSDIYKMSEPHAIESQPLRIGGVMGVTAVFIGFDEKTWDQENNCDVKSTTPDFEYRDIDKVLFFKGGLEELKSKVDQEAASITDVKESFNEHCALEIARDKAKTTYDIIKEYIKK